MRAVWDRGIILGSTRVGGHAPRREGASKEAAGEDGRAVIAEGGLGGLVVRGGLEIGLAGRDTGRPSCISWPSKAASLRFSKLHVKARS